MHHLIRRAVPVVALLCVIATTPGHADGTLKLDAPKPNVAPTPPAPTARRHA
jgi:alpha-galactosidase